MIVVYTSPGCASCRKVKQWLKDRDLPFVEKNIFKTILDDDEIKYLLSRTENGSDDIISRRSKVLSDKAIDIDSMSVNELVAFIRQNPSVLKRPIILNEKSFQVGYDSEEIGVFIPEELRRIAFHSCVENCPNYRGCGSVRETEGEDSCEGKYC